ncbi:hypothetical protein D0N42_02480, partial [Micrococcus luteus]
TEILTSRGGEGTKTWMAGSEALCGGWSAETPPLDEAGPMTFTLLGCSGPAAWVTTAGPADRPRRRGSRSARLRWRARPPGGACTP